VARADVVFVATTADAHPAVARDVAAALRPGTVVVLYCGYVGGALVFRRALAEAGADPDAVTVVETKRERVEADKEAKRARQAKRKAKDAKKGGAKPAAPAA
jgi:hypothetical protein